MRATIRTLLTIALAAAGCGRAPTGGGAGGLGTIEGTVSGAGGQSLRVEVPGGPSATTDAAARFLLTDVPGGTSSLRFTGGPVDSTLGFPPMVAGEYRWMSVSVGASAGLHMDRCGSEFRGTVDAIDEMGHTITVAGRLITVTDTTRIEKGGAEATFADLAVGQNVEIRGDLQADGSVIAAKIRILVGPLDDPNQLVLLGTIGAIDGTSLTVSGLPVDASGADFFRGETAIALVDLAVGDKVLVRGVFTGGVIVASVVRVLEVCEGPPSHPEIVYLHGVVKAVDTAAGTLTIGPGPGSDSPEVVLAVTADTVIRRGDASIGLGDLVLGEEAFAKATKASDGGLTAKLVVVRAVPPPGTEICVAGHVDAVGTDDVTIGGKKLLVDSSTVIRRGDTAIQLSDLVVGEEAAARAEVQSDGSLRAIWIRVMTHHM